MDKYILCLANSYKHGGRCIAGIEVELNNGALSIKKGNYGLPIWIRPVSHSLAGEIPMSHAQGVHVLSVVKVHDAVYAGSGAHSEDHYYSRLEVIQKLNPSDQFLRQYVDSWHSNIFGNRGKALTPEAFHAGDYSLMLIRTEGAEVYLEERFQKQRVKFTFAGNQYDFPITDPEFLNRLRIDSSLFRSYGTLYIVASLGVEHEGWHSKLAATLITPATSGIVERVQPRVSPSPSVSRTVAQARPSTVSRPTSSYSSLSSRPTTNTTSRPSYGTTSSNSSSKPTPRQTYSSPKPTYSSSSNSSSGGCYVATAIYGSYDCPEVWTLRRFRDNTLAKSIIGRAFIKVYYSTSPAIVRRYGSYSWFSKRIKPILDKMVHHLNEKGVSSTPYNDRQW